MGDVLRPARPAHPRVITGENARKGGRGRSLIQRGQSLVEFAMVLPVLLLLLLFGLDFGRVFLGLITLNNAARIAANYAASGQPPLSAAQLTQYQAIVGRETAGLNCTLVGSTNPTFPAGTAVGSRAVVNLTCAFTPITPFISGFFPGGTVDMTAMADFPIRAGVLANISSGGGTTYVAPNQDFTPSPTSGPAPLTVSVTLGTQLGGAAQTYAWNWGDSALIDNSAQPLPHQYTVAGTYTITLVETNPGGPSGTMSHVVTVAPAAAAPVAGFYGTITDAACSTITLGTQLAESCGGSTGALIYYKYSPNPTVAFTDTSTNATGATYAWDFGDPTSSTNTSTAENPSHTYTLPGPYTVTETVTTAGGTNVATRTAYVNLGCLVPSFTNVSTTSSAGGASDVWTTANFIGNNLDYWRTGGTYKSTMGNQSNYLIGQQNPQGGAFFTSSKSGNSYACTTAGRVAPTGAVPAP